MSGTATATASAMDIEAAQRGIFEVAWSGGPDTILEETYADGYVLYGPLIPDGVKGVEGERARIAGFRSAFPDLVFTVVDQVVSGDRGVARWTVSGTHLGPFAGIAATGKAVSGINGVSLTRWSEGKCVETWTLWDVQALLNQIGS